jgi:uncharacterized protein YdeI (YjbR/CyaY-like superfamily)
VLNKEKEIPVIQFPDLTELKKWLDENHDKSPGFLLKIGKGDHKGKTVTYAEALEPALCYGWIDGQKLPLNEKFWLQKFTPRKKNSIWSKMNRERAEKLIKAGKMKPAGLSVIEEAKKNGQWEKAYDGQSSMAVPDDFKKALMKDKKANRFFESLNRVNRYAILFRIHSAKKEETRKARIKKFITMLHNEEKIHN